MEKGLALSRATGDVAGMTMDFDLRDVATHGEPSFYLSLVVLAASSQIITTIPLKPASRVVGVNPAFFPPIGQGFRGVDLEKVQARVTGTHSEFGVGEPAGGEFAAAVCHVFAAKHAKSEHLLGGKLWLETWRVISAYRLGANIPVIGLHSVIDDDELGTHG